MTAPTAPELDAQRDIYRRLCGVFIANNLPLKMFSDRLRGETDVKKINEGVAAMRSYLIYRGFLEDHPDVCRVPEDNRPEFDLAHRDSVQDYLDTTPIRDEIPPAQRAQGIEPVADKFYMLGTTPFRAARSRGGNIYAVRRDDHGQWAYVAGAAAQIRKHGRAATVEDIAAYGLAIGRCFVCGKRLTNPESARRGIGPHCAKSLGR